MSVEDFWWDTHNELSKLGLQKKFDKQIKKMQTQSKHKWKTPVEKWEYAYNKVRKNNGHNS